MSMENDFIVYNNYGYNEEIDENGSIIINNTFKKFNLLGEGSYWKVNLVKRNYECHDYIDDNYYVFKEGVLSIKDDEAVFNRLSNTNLNEEDQEVRIGVREMNILSTINHINIARLYETILDTQKNKIVFVMEYCDLGCIMNILPNNEAYEDNKNLYKLAEEYGLIEKYEENSKDEIYNRLKLGLFLFKQLANAIQYLHIRLICHRDIKIDNIMIKTNKETKNIEVKLVDFSISRKLSSTDDIIESTQGTDIYKPEEMINSYEHNPFKVDIYNFGTSFYMFLFNDFSFSLLSEKCCYIKSHYLSIYSLLEETLSNDPSKRPTIQELYSKINDIHI